MKLLAIELVLVSCLCVVIRAHKCAEDDLECHEKAKYTKGIGASFLEFLNLFMIKLKRRISPANGKSTWISLIKLKRTFKSASTPTVHAIKSITSFNDS